MLPKINRLKKTKEIERVFETGKGYQGDFLFLKLMKNSLGVSRFAFVVSQKVAKKATRRNKVKRRLRGVIGSRLSEIKTGFDCVVVARQGAETQDFQELKKEVENLFKKSKLL